MLVCEEDRRNCNQIIRVGSSAKEERKSEGKVSVRRLKIKDKDSKRRVRGVILNKH